MCAWLPPSAAPMGRTKEDGNKSPPCFLLALPCGRAWQRACCFCTLHAAPSSLAPGCPGVPCRGVHAKCNFPLPEEEAFQAQLLASQQETWQGGQGSPTAAAPQASAQVAFSNQPQQAQAAFSEAVCIPCGEPHASQLRAAAVQAAQVSGQ